MSYRIVYTSSRNQSRASSSRLVCMTIMFLLLTGILVTLLWPEGRQLLTRCLLPESMAVTASAVEEMTQALQSGTSLRDALSALSRVVREGVPVGSDR